ncbi:MAG: hypothetical protein GY808_06635 [Gammaproteobacteria bacterium]|nr:hypothetical protein [Gammaproteobacteria bacterium]
MGIIRVIGRYWHADSSYNAKLTANFGNRTGEIELKLIRPDMLGNSTFAIQRDNGIDIEGNNYSVDDICIKYGGIYGFPPQNIKGQYQEESAFVNNAYHPSYRLEPWRVDIERRLRRAGYSNGNFWVTSNPNSMGRGNPVPNHQNVEYMQYVNTPHSVWYYIGHYTNIINQGAPPYGGLSIFGVYQASTGLLIFTKYRIPRNEYERIRNIVYDDLDLNTAVNNIEANLEARQRFIDYMRDDYAGYDVVEGLQNHPAQSRALSSFGPIQTMYQTAVGRGYPQEVQNTPENLNDMEIFFPYAFRHHIYLLERQTGQGQAETNNWQHGHDEIMRRIYHGWNPLEDYDTNVLNNAMRYIPAMNQ